MLVNQPLRHRIVIAFTLMTLIVSGMFSLGIVGIVHFVEEQIVTHDLKVEITTFLKQDLSQDSIAGLDDNTRFFVSKPLGSGIPEPFASYPAGFTEIVDGDQAYYLYIVEDKQQRYALVQEQHEFEAREKALYRTVLAGFIISVLSALGLGWFMAQKIMQPVIKLARQVRHRDQLLPLAPQLSQDYSEDEIGDLAVAFDDTLGKLRSSLEREQLFTSDVSHELRTPLMVISTSAELMVLDPLTVRQRELLKRIEKASREMKDLVQVFLTLARAKPEHTNSGEMTTLQAVAIEQVNQWQSIMESKGLDFKLVVEAECSDTYHTMLLTTVMSNLIRNAFHYTDQGYIRLILESHGFRVEDSGRGISLEERDTVFSPFTRGKNARGEGLGLGLSLVKRICDMQGWCINMYSTHSCGSCFSVDLKRPA